MTVRSKLLHLCSASALLALGTLALAGCDDSAASANNPDVASDLLDTDDTADSADVDTSTPDTADTADTDVDVSPLPCLANGDCPAGEVCRIIVDAGGAVQQLCGPPIGPGGPGAVCTDDSECQSGACVNGQCASACDDDTDCPSGFACEQHPVGSETIGVCVGQPTTCAADSDCAGGERCLVDRSGSELVLTCGTPVGAGDLGATCTADAQCANNLCLAGACTLPCARVIDCDETDGFTCDSTSVPTDGGGAVDANVCQPIPPNACLSDNDCTAAGERCVAEKSPAELGFVCGAPNAGGREAGENCAADADCAQNLCVAGQCAAPCQQAGRDCPTDFGCELSPVDLGNGVSDQASLCRPPTLCTEDDACLLSEVCYVRREQSDVTLLCSAPNLGSPPGQVCSEDSDCRGNLCVTTRFRDVCSQPCVDNADCDAAGYQCTDSTLDALDGTDVPVRICLPAPAPACTSQADCATGTVCAVVANPANTALETVCIPNPGGTAVGVACTANEQCTSQLCLGGFCSAPCTAPAQCANGQLCRSSTVSKDGLGGTFELCETPPDTLCGSSAQCSATSRVCGDIRFTATAIDTACVFPNTGGANLGASCANDTECFHNICSPTSSECSVACTLDTDCASGQICTAYRFGLSGGGTDNLQLCARGCVDDASCAVTGGNPTAICTVNSNFVDNTIDQVCEDRVGTGDVGAPCTGATGLQDGSMCIRGICLRTTLQNTPCTTNADCTAPYTCKPAAGGGTVCAIDECTALCDSGTDCTSSTVPGNALTLCSQSITISPPNGGTPQTISACARN